MGWCMMRSKDNERKYVCLIYKILVLILTLHYTSLSLFLDLITTPFYTNSTLPYFITPWFLLLSTYSVCLTYAVSIAEEGLRTKTFYDNIIILLLKFTIYLLKNLFYRIAGKFGKHYIW